MKIGIQTWGSHGDIRPMLALAEGLQAAGHQVHLVITCIDDAMEGATQSTHGVRITVLASPVLTPVQQEQNSRTAYATRNPMTQLAAILRLCFAPVEDAMFAAAQQLAAESDLLIGHYFMHPLQVAAEQAGRPYVSVLLSHLAIPSDVNHPLGDYRLGKYVHRLLWRAMRQMLNGVLLPYPNRLRALAGLPPVTDIVTQVWMTQPLTLAAVSPQLCRVQPDWPASVRVCGFLDTPGLAIDGRLPDALSDFLDAGAAPVYMSFGSWMAKDIAGQTRDLRLLTEAARLAGCRAIIQSDSARDCGSASSADVLYVTAAPHAAIFPRCAAIVHHGGAGTTQSALLAGKPSIVVANIDEQAFWGRELRSLGVGARLARRRSVTAGGLARRIRSVVASPAMGPRAEEIGAQMRRERGVDAAVALIEAQFNSEVRDAA